MRSTLLLLFVLASCIPLNSQRTLKEASPESAGFSASKLNRIDSLVRSYVDHHWIAGATAIVARDGKIVYYKATGYDNIEKKTPLKRDAIYRIASQTKALTCVAIMMLYDEGKLKLTDPVSKFLPEFKNQTVLQSFSEADTTYTTVPVKRDVTIQDLMTHPRASAMPRSVKKLPPPSMLKTGSRAASAFTTSPWPKKCACLESCH